MVYADGERISHQGCRLVVSLIAPTHGNRAFEIRFYCCLDGSLLLVPSQHLSGEGVSQALLAAVVVGRGDGLEPGDGGDSGDGAAPGRRGLDRELRRHGLAAGGGPLTHRARARGVRGVGEGRQLTVAVRLQTTCTRFPKLGGVFVEI